MKPKSVANYRFDGTEGRETMSLFINWAFHVMELHEIDAVWYERKVFDMFHGDDFRIKATRDRLTIVTSCSKMV